MSSFHFGAGEADGHVEVFRGSIPRRGGGRRGGQLGPRDGPTVETSRPCDSSPLYVLATYTCTTATIS
jgi:hypothetical protein